MPFLLPPAVRPLRSFRRALWVSVFGLALAGGATAEPFAFYVENRSQGSSLLRMDLETRERDAVGDTVAGLLALQFDSTGRLWAVNGASLFRLDPTTGRASEVGPLGAVPLGPEVDLAMSPAGELWLSADAEGPRLFTVSLDTGEATLRASLDHGVAGIAFVGEQLILSVSLGEGTDQLVAFDPESGAVTPLAESPISPAEFPISMDGFNDILYIQGVNLVSTLPITLYSLDLETGDASVVASEFSIAHWSRSLAICHGPCRGSQVTDVPTASTMGLALLAAILTSAGLALRPPA
ncbi:MAG: hypothetical protein AAGM22_32155 [Acidobacteriota bacterium]